MLETANVQLMEDKDQLESRIMQVHAENNELKTENNQLKTENTQQKTEIIQLRNKITAGKIQQESQHKKERLHLEFHHQKEKQILQSEVEQLTEKLERITTVSVGKKLLVSFEINFSFIKIIFS